MAKEKWFGHSRAVSTCLGTCVKHVPGARSISIYSMHTETVWLRRMVRCVKYVPWSRT